MVNIKLGDKTYENVEAVKLDTPEGGTVEFAPYEETFAAGKAEGTAEGKKSEYDRFWDTYQRNGTRTEYDRDGGRNFASECWSFANFYPKYDIRTVGSAHGLFYNWSDEQHKGNLAQRLRDCGVILDTSKAITLRWAFRYCRSITHIPEIDATGATRADGLDYTFGDIAEAASLTIEKLIVNENNTYLSTFDYARGLVSVTFEGVIGHSLSFGWSAKLNSESVQSIVDHLKDLTGQTAETLTFHADVGAKLTEAQKAAITAKNWTLVY